MRRFTLYTSSMVLFCTALAPRAFVEDTGPRFNKDILPILAEHCFACHGSDAAAREANLRLDTEEGLRSLLEGGTSAVVAGERSTSEVFLRITGTDDMRMPPVEDGDALSKNEIARIGAWIDAGASWEHHWAHILPKKPPVPAVHDSRWAQNPIDHFILAALDAKGIGPSSPADAHVLLRRLHLDLTGLPPTSDDLIAFLGDSEPGGVERVVDRLLASPHFGEKWARWWLDLASYADSDGYLSDFIRPQAWRYRQWVVDALNDDMPFDQFTVEQMAGDLLPNATISQRVATGFNRNTLSNREGGADLEDYRTMQATERVISLGTVWLAQTLECARCHDHKYDAISQQEFYELYAFYNNSDEINIDAPLNDQAEHYGVAWPAYLAKREALLAPIAEELAALQTQWEAKLLWAEINPGVGDYHWDRAWEVLGLIWGQNLGEGQLEGNYIVHTPEEERTDSERVRLQDYFLGRGSLVNEERFRALGLSAVAEKLEALKEALPEISRAPTLRENRTRREAHIFDRGDFRSPREPVTPGTLSALHSFEGGDRPTRLDLARWIVDPRNPLTARVTANRLWQELFGRGIVATSDDFGVRGDAPSHPELLDWLATEFVESGWHIKTLLKTIVLSATYQQASTARPDLDTLDPDNLLLARHSRTRLSAELVRDNALAASGLLNPAIGGPSVRPPQPESVSKGSFDATWTADENANQYRRGLYTFIQRTSPYGQYVNFDFPENSRPCTRRERSNTPLQALNLLNDENFFGAARALAGKTFAHENRLDVAYQRCLVRTPTLNERKRLESLYDDEVIRLRQDPDAIEKIVGSTEGLPVSAEAAAWVVTCSVLLNLDEFITKE